MTTHHLLRIVEVLLTLKTLWSVQTAPYAVSNPSLIIYRSNVIPNLSFSLQGNKQGECLPKEETEVQSIGFSGYMEFTWVFFVALLAVCCLLALLSYAYDKRKNTRGQRTLHRQSTTDEDAKYAVNTIGHESVYQFLLGDNVWGWVIVLATILVQIGVLFVFVRGSEANLSTEGKSDVRYTWFCPRDVDKCTNDSDLDWRGWIVFGVLMIAYVLKDTISGAKMIILSAKQRHATNYRVRFFCGGVLLSAVTLFSLYVTTIYNIAIATSELTLLHCTDCFYCFNHLMTCLISVTSKH